MEAFKRENDISSTFGIVFFTFCVAIAVMNTWKNGDSKFLKFDIM